MARKESEKLASAHITAELLATTLRRLDHPATEDIGVIRGAEWDHEGQVLVVWYEDAKHARPLTIALDRIGASLAEARKLQA